MFPGGRPLQNHPPSGVPPAQYPGIYYSPGPSVSNPTWYQNPASSGPFATAGSGGTSKDILADSYERMRNEMRSLQSLSSGSKMPSSRPMAPPPPSMDASQEKYDPLTTLLDNKDVSLSSLLEAAMDPSVGSNKRSEDPIMKKTILDKCEGKIAQLYRHRISGHGLFFPLKEPKSRKIDGSSMLEFHHPRLEFNSPPLQRIWNCPEVSIDMREEKDEKVKSEECKGEPITSVARRDPSEELKMNPMNVDVRPIETDTDNLASSFPTGVFDVPPPPVPAPRVSVPDPYAKTAIDLWAELERDRRKKELRAQMELLRTGGVDNKRKKKKKKRNRSSSSSSSSTSERGYRRSRSKSYRRSPSGSHKSGRKSRSERSRSFRSKERSRRSHSRSRERRRRRRSSSSLSLSPPRRKTPLQRKYDRTPSPRRRSAISPARVHGMVGEWPRDNVPYGDPSLRLQEPPPYGSAMWQQPPPPFNYGSYGFQPHPQAPGNYPLEPRYRHPLPYNAVPQTAYRSRHRSIDMPFNEKVAQSLLAEVIVLEDEENLTNADNIYPPGEQPPSSAKYPGLESEYTKPLREEFRKLLKPIDNVLDFIRELQRNDTTFKGIIKGLETAKYEFEGIYTLVDGLLCRLAVERGKDKFFKIAIPEVRRFRTIKEIHRVYHDYSIHRLQDIIADVLPQDERGIFNNLIVTVFRECQECDARDFQRMAMSESVALSKNSDKTTVKRDAEAGKSVKRGGVEEKEKKKHRRRSSTAEKRDELKEEELIKLKRAERFKRDEERFLKEKDRKNKKDSKISGMAKQVASGVNNVATKDNGGSKNDVQVAEVDKTGEEVEQSATPDKIQEVEKLSGVSKKEVNVINEEKNPADGQTGSEPAKPKMNAPEDFKFRVRRVQMKVAEFKEAIDELEGPKKKSKDAAFLLKAGMLCRRVPSATDNCKNEVKISVDPSTLLEMVHIVHTMAPVHAPSQKTSTLFNKHFVPIDGLAAAVSTVVDQCEQCKK